MEITEVRIKLMEEPNDRLQAFCSITLDGSFVIRDLKIIQGSRGSFVAMPSRKLNDRCPRCGSKNELRAGYCSQCGNKLNQERATRDHNGRAKLYADIAHPINTECREMIQREVLEAFEEELVKSEQPNYICRYDDYGESEFASEAEPLVEQTKVPVSTPKFQSPERRLDQAAEPGTPHVAGPVQKPTEKLSADGFKDGFGAGVN